MARPTQRPAFLGNTAIAGVGYTQLTKASGRSVLDLATEASAGAIEDAGLTPAEVDGVASFQFLEDSVPAQAVATALGMPGSNWLVDLNLGGQAPCYLVTQAAMAVHLGLARHVVVYRALNGRSGARVGTNRAPGPATDFRYPVGLTAYVHYISLWARRFLIETGQTEADLASVAVAQRAYAEQNERAYLRAPHSLEAHFAAPYVAEPFRMPDCTIEVDGASAVVVTTLDAARDLPHPPAVLEGAAYAAGRGPGLDMGDSLFWEDLSRNYTSLLADDLWGSAGLAPADVDLAEIYDCFTSTVLMGLEGLGLAERGGGGDFVRRGALPVNTHGGLLAEGYLHGMNTVAEAALQLQGRAGGRTVAGAETCVVTSGALTDGSALVLAVDPVIPPAGEIDAAAFWAALDDGALLVSVCGACDHRWLPPLATCPRCASRDVTNAPAAPTGALYSWTVIHLAADSVYATETPYTVGLVELDDGTRLYGRIVGVDHDDLRDALRLRVAIDTTGDQPIWSFGPE